MKILQVPENFLLKDVVSYPTHNTDKSLEYYAHEYFLKIDEEVERTFIPIKWTSYQVAANYGKDKEKMEFLKNFCKSLPSNQSYFTVVQYADGILTEVPNCIVFSSGGIGDIPIPLSTKRLPFNNLKKEIIANFCGRFDTHTVRKLMRDTLVNEKYVFRESISPILYSEIIEKSYFTLCPRGYGKTSFRLYEAMQLGSVPVYISDEHWLPFSSFVDWSKFCVVITIDQLKDIPEILSDIMSSGRYTEMREEALRVYNEYFSFESMFKWVLKILKRD